MLYEVITVVEEVVDDLRDGQTGVLALLVIAVAVKLGLDLLLRPSELFSLSAGG